MKTNYQSERGQAMVVIVIAILGLIAITALAVDGGMYYADRKQAQNAADSAVLAASLARLRGEDYESAALLNAHKNGYDNNGTRSEILVSAPPLSGPYAGDNEYIQVVIASHHKTYFGSVIGIHEMTNTVQAIARAKPPEWGPVMDGYAVVSLAPLTGCQKVKGFWAHGESTLELWGGGVFINSDNPTCAFIQEGSASLVFGDATLPFNIVGGASIQKVQLIKRIVSSPVSTQSKNTIPYRPATLAFLPSTGNSAIPYPPPFDMPKIGCGSQKAEIDPKDETTMTPGYWDDNFPPEGVNKLKSGVYCINGNVRVDDGELQGNNVVLVVESGSVHFSNEATISLGAPVSGQYKGLLLYLPTDNRSVVVLGGSADSSYRGTILAPGSKIRIVGNESRYGFHSQIIGYTIELDGNSKIIVRYLDEQNYDTFSNPEIQLGQ